MNYEQKHQEDLEAAKGWLAIAKENDNKIAIQILEKFFPELRESEDERTRKELIEYLKKFIPHHDCDLVAKSKEWIAWLEKQREQKPIMIQWTGDNLKELVHFTGKSPKFEEWFKTWEDFENYVHTHNNIFKIFNEDGSHVEVPVGAWIIKTPDGYNVASRYVFKKKPADKIEPKFKVGDWITNGEYTWNVTDIKPLDYVLQSQNGDVIDDTISYVDEEFHLWTIEDAKDGDVISDKNPFIFRGFGDKEHPNSPTAYCGINFSDTFILSSEDDWWTADNVHPATKEQCDLLFQKMREAGYVWYAEKKELKEILQEYLLTPEECINPTWSIEDETGWTNTMIMIKEVASNHYTKESIKLVIDWLESIKDRIQPQPKQEWSEEDERHRKRIIQRLEDIRKSKEDNIDVASVILSEINWLKSIIKPNHWKPSEEQIEAFEIAVHDAHEHSYYKNLFSLYNDLKKLHGR